MWDSLVPVDRFDESLWHGADGRGSGVSPGGPWSSRVPIRNRRLRSCGTPKSAALRMRWLLLVVIREAVARLFHSATSSSRMLA